MDLLFCIPFPFFQPNRGDILGNKVIPFLKGDALDWGETQLVTSSTVLMRSFDQEVVIQDDLAKSYG